MELILIRHGEPDYSHISKNENTQIPTMAHLSEIGKLQAENIYKNNIDLLNNSQIIISSPFNRALETAKILNKNLNLPLFIENDMHEWLPDREFKYNIDKIHDFYKDYKIKNGIRISNEPWEEDLEVKKRVLNCLSKYSYYEKIIIVAHSRLFKIVFNIKECNFCSVNKINFDYK